MIITGIFIGSLLGFGVPTNTEEMKTSEFWRVMFGIQGIFGVFHLALFLAFFNYDTPKYLKMTNQEEKLDAVLNRIYHAEDVAMVKTEMDENSSGDSKDVGFKDALFHP
jgi:MFS family permease